MCVCVRERERKREREIRANAMDLFERGVTTILFVFVLDDERIIYGRYTVYVCVCVCV